MASFQSANERGARRPGRFHSLGVVATGLFAAVLALSMLARVGGVAAASGATMRIAPSATSVAGGASFTVELIENAASVTIGAQATLTFDPTLVAVTDLKPGDAYDKGLSFFGVSFDGSPDKLTAAVTTANQTGTLVVEATGIIPAGDAAVVTVTMQAIKGPGGTATLGLRSASMVDQDGNALPVAATGGTVTVAATAGVTAPPRPSGLVNFTPGPDSAVMSVAPDSPQVAVGATVAIQVKITTASTQIGLIKASLTFDNTLLQIEQVEAGPLVKGAALQSGLTTLDAGIQDANSSGKLNEVRIPVATGVDAQGMDGTVLIITVKGLANGTSTLDLGAGLETPDAGYIAVVAQPSQLIVGTGGTQPDSGGTTGQNGAGGGGFGIPGMDPLFFTLAVLLGLLAIADVLLFILPRRPHKQRLWLRRWPYVVSLVLAMIPVVMFAAIVGIVVMNALPAVNDPGLGALLGDKFVGKFSGSGVSGSYLYGLLPAVAGTVLMTVVALAFALPASLAMAIVSTEFPMGPVGRVVRPAIAALSGIPPIVYAVSLLVFVHVFMIPKFAANSSFPLDPASIGANPATWPPPDVPYNSGAFAWNLTITGGNSTLLGGVLIALLLIPFMTPMIVDAIRNVPSSAREASLALGANRGYTLRKAILPMAKPGIATALVLGALKALGDIVIVSFAIGWEAGVVPNPIVDVLEKTPSLAAEGANMIVPFNTPDATALPTDAAVGYASAQSLLVLAGVMVVLINFLKNRWRRSLGV